MALCSIYGLPLASPSMHGAPHLAYLGPALWKAYVTGLKRTDRLRLVVVVPLGRGLSTKQSRTVHPRHERQHVCSLDSIRTAWQASEHVA